ncbi:MAG: ABC transporter permease [Chloroflexi bacterium]|nr:ABC transporter permease [Chloroflexota bacterium]
MLKIVRHVFIKEARDLLRDRRALFFLFATPLLMPILGAIGGVFVLWQIVRQTRDGLPIVIVNGEQLPGLVAELDDKVLLQLVDAPPDLEQALQGGELMAVLEIPPDAMDQLEAEQAITLTLTSSRSGWLPEFAVTTVQQALRKYEHEVLTDRLARQGLDPAWINPIRLAQEATATTGVAAAPIVSGEGASSLIGSLFLTMAVASWTFSGGLSLVADMTVGEKERHTMEPLLITPSSRIGIVLGKIALSIIVSAITIGLWSLDSLAYVSFLSIIPMGTSSSLAMPGVTQLGNLGQALVWLMLLMLPLMTMANGIVATVCTFAKNYREANLFLGLLQLLLPGVALVATFGVSAAPPMSVYALPMVGVLVAMRDLFGGGVAPGALALTWGAAAAYAVVSILLAAYAFSREWALMRGV